MEHKITQKRPAAQPVYALKKLAGLRTPVLWWAAEESMNKQKLIAGLNQDLNNELAASMRYLLEAAILRGLAGHEARELFQGEVTAEMQHAILLADKISALGGTPVIKPELPTPVTDTKRALKREFDFERQAVANYTQRIKDADECGEIGLRMELEKLLTDETNHAEEIARLMG